jgi:hypothetical protein
MSKKKAARLAGFIGALCATGALVGAGVQATGAYFTSSQTGTMHASSGHLTLSATHPAQLNMDFQNLMPGKNVQHAVDYSVDVSSGNVDLWLVFNKDSQEYNKFTGGSGNTNWSDGGLGRYGYFSVSDSNGGRAFRSGNLKFATAADDPQSSDSCATNATTGRGGSDWIATAGDYSPTEFCGVPDAIKLAGGLSDGATGTVTITFGLNGYMQTEQNQPEFNLPFKIVATQAGHVPNDSYQP